MYIFGQRVIEFDIEELAKQFQSSSVVIADILTIVFTFTSAWYYEAAAGDGTPEKITKWKKNQHPKKKRRWQANHWSEGKGQSGSHQKGWHI